MSRGVRICIVAASLMCAASLEAQSTFTLGPSLTHVSMRDERASPLTYRGTLWGGSFAWSRVSQQAIIGVEIEGAHGPLGSRITDGRLSSESASVLAIRGAYARPLRRAPAWSVGASLLTTAGLRVHYYETNDAGFGELLVAAGPVLGHATRLHNGSLNSEFAVSALALLVRPYADARVARNGDVHARAGFTHQIAAAHFRTVWQPDRSVQLAYRLSVQRVADADHFGSITHTLGLGFALGR